MTQNRAGGPLRRRPTMRGAVLFLAGFGLFLLATHFSSNAVFMLAFGCLALPLAAPLTIWFGPRNLQVRMVPPAAFCAHAPLTCQFQISGKSNGVVQVETDLGVAQRQGADRLEMSLSGLPRGLHDLGQMQVAVYDPLGLFRVSRDLTAQETRGVAHLVVYPQPDWLNPAPAIFQGATGNKLVQSGDPAGLRPYRSGDAPRDVDWKASARIDGLMVREYEESAEAGACVFAWDQAAQRDPEQALSRLCAGVLEAARNGAAPGLHLPAIQIEPDRGARHIDGLMRALAGYRAPQA